MYFSQIVLSIMYIITIFNKWHDVISFKFVFKGKFWVWNVAWHLFLIFIRVQSLTLDLLLASRSGHQTFQKLLENFSFIIFQCNFKKCKSINYEDRLINLQLHRFLNQNLCTMFGIVVLNNDLVKRGVITDRAMRHVDAFVV